MFEFSFKKWLEQIGYFKKINLKAPTPVPIFGNFLSLMHKGIARNDVDQCRLFGKTHGEFLGSAPTINTADVNLIKCIMIKDFNYFVNRRV